MEQAGCHLLISQAGMSGCLGPLEEISRHLIEQLEAVAIVSTALRPDQSKC
jgi:hypothetical protein